MVLKVFFFEWNEPMGVNTRPKIKKSQPHQNEENAQVEPFLGDSLGRMVVVVMKLLCLLMIRFSALVSFKFSNFRSENPFDKTLLKPIRVTQKK